MEEEADSPPQEVITSELDYKVKIISHPSYQLSQLSQQSGTATVNLDNNGGQESIFELPPKVFNLARSVLSFTITPTLVTGKNIWAHVNGITPIRQLQLFTRTGLYLCDLNDVNSYSNVTMRYRANRNEVLSWDKASDGSGFFEGLIPTNDTAGTFSTTSTPILSSTGAGAPYGVAISGPGTVTYTTTLTRIKRPDNSSVKSFITEPGYVMNGGSGTATPVINFQIPLRNFHDTIFSVDKDILFGDSLYLRIVWAPTIDIFYANNSATNPVGTGIEAVNGAELTALKLYACIEQNQVINNRLMAKVKSGHKLQIPYVYSNKVNVNNSTSHNVSVRYNRAHGKKLKRIYWVPFNPTGANNKRYDHSNLVGSKIEEYYTMLNNVRSQQFNYVTKNGIDWLDKRYMLNGSCIGSSNEYYYNWVHIEEFTKPKQASIIEQDTSNENDGYLLDTEVKFDAVAQNNTGPLSLNHYIYAVCIKDMTISLSGITLD